MWYGDKCRVRLDVDLTRYHRNLVPGALGWLIPNTYTDVWAKNYDRFGVVDWDDAPRRDILIANLTILKGDDIEAKAPDPSPDPEEAAMKATLRHVCLVLGPRGGWKTLSYVWTSSGGGHRSCSHESRRSGEEMLAKFKAWGVEVQQMNEDEWDRKLELGYFDDKPNPAAGQPRTEVDAALDRWK